MTADPPFSPTTEADLYEYLAGRALGIVTQALIDKARLTAPVLAGAPVIERWAGLRPKAVGRDPMVGRHPDHANLSLMTGGFKVSFGLAHALSRAVLDEIEGGALDVPPSFTVPAHFEAAGRV